MGLTGLEPVVDEDGPGVVVGPVAPCSLPAGLHLGVPAPPIRR